MVYYRKLDFSGLHFVVDSMHGSNFNYGDILPPPKVPEFGEVTRIITAITPFKVIQGHRIKSPYGYAGYMQSMLIINCQLSHRRRSRVFISNGKRSSEHAEVRPHASTNDCGLNSPPRVEYRMALYSESDVVSASCY